MTPGRQLTLIADELQQPPYPADVLANGWHFELNPGRIENSDTWTMAGQAVLQGAQDMRPWLLMLWMKAWQQTPCGSLPVDDALIAARIGMDPRLFSAHRGVLLRDWWQASDGRLYTQMLIDAVRRMQLERGARGYRKHLDEVLARCGAKCWYCGCVGVSFTLDHVMPRSRGGSSDPANLVPACRSCNSRKGARTPEEWLA